jgi:hypothetical protein
MNNHIMRMDKNSLLLQRAFQVAKLMPLNHPDFQNSIIDKLCKPNGYYQVGAYPLLRVLVMGWSSSVRRPASTTRLSLLFPAVNEQF